nr:RNA-directed DNA polymerase, eukaryota, reverse transcriptase zinc-binding domain protein [Tanacetum cinerariifolium]
SWNGVARKFALLNVYGPQSNAKKALLWNSIETLFNSIDVTWTIFRDFNAVRSVDERVGSRFNVTEPDIRLKDKVKLLRMDVKTWISIRLSSQRGAKDRLSRVLVDWDIKAEVRLVNHFDIDKREEWVMDLHALDQFSRDDLKQKSRVRWAVEGDENSRYFHSLIRNKFASFRYCRE